MKTLADWRYLFCALGGAALAQLGFAPDWHFGWHSCAGAIVGAVLYLCCENLDDE